MSIILPKLESFIYLSGSGSGYGSVCGFRLRVPHSGFPPFPYALSQPIQRQTNFEEPKHVNFFSHGYAVARDARTVFLFYLSSHYHFYFL